MPWFFINTLKSRYSEQKGSHGLVCYIEIWLSDGVLPTQRSELIFTHLEIDFSHPKILGSRCILLGAALTQDSHSLDFHLCFYSLLSKKNSLQGIGW